MRKTPYNTAFDIERRIREIRTLHAMSKIPTRDAKLMLNDLERVFADTLEKLPYEQRDFFLKNRMRSF